MVYARSSLVPLSFYTEENGPRISDTDALCAGAARRAYAAEKRAHTHTHTRARTRDREGHRADREDKDED